jgi:hypothetical protein
MADLSDWMPTRRSSGPLLPESRRQNTDPQIFCKNVRQPLQGKSQARTEEILSQSPRNVHQAKILERIRTRYQKALAPRNLKQTRLKNTKSQDDCACICTDEVASASDHATVNSWAQDDSKLPNTPTKEAAAVMATPNRLSDEGKVVTGSPSSLRVP